MFSLLYETCRLLLSHFLHCFVYALPAQAALALCFYLLKSNAPMGLVFACAVVFFLLNTLYIYSGTQQLLKRKPGVVDFIGAMHWRRTHFDFFLYIAIGMIALSALAVYFIDAVGYVQEEVKRLTDLQSEAEHSGEWSAANSYTVILAGSKFLSYTLLILILLIWMRICRVGIRIAAYVEGYYLRSEEALLLTGQNTLAPLACSFVLIVTVTGYTNFLARQVPHETFLWMLPLLWAGGYFLTVTAHLALWVNVYRVYVKMTGYHMGRINP